MFKGKVKITLDYMFYGVIIVEYRGVKVIM